MEDVSMILKVASVPYRIFSASQYPPPLPRRCRACQYPSENGGRFDIAKFLEGVSVLCKHWRTYQYASDHGGRRGTHPTLDGVWTSL